MWTDVTLLLREFARRPTIDRPDCADPGLDVARLGVFGLLGLIFRSLAEPQGPSSPLDYTDARWTSLLDH